MNFTAKDVAELREITGAGMMDCKKALTHTDGDKDKAIEYLREIGVNIAAKKAGRIASEGLIGGYTDGTTGALAELNCETDFVANTAGFRALVTKVAEGVAKNAPADVDTLLEMKIDGSTVTEMVNAETAKCGEKITARRFERFSVAEGVEEIYLHNGGKIGVMLEVETDKPATAEIKDGSRHRDAHRRVLSFVRQRFRSPRRLHRQGEVHTSRAGQERSQERQQA